MDTFSQRLRAKLSLVQPALCDAAAELLAGDNLRPRYVAYLSLLHTIIRASVPLMEAAADQAERLGGTINHLLAAYLRQHIPEERGHDDWLLRDLAVLDIDPAEVTDRCPPRLVAEMVGSQYYLILHHHPVCLLGYIAALEGCPPTPSGVDRLVTRSGLPRAAFDTLMKHAHLDPHHARDLDCLLDVLPLTPEHETDISANGMYTVACVTRLFRQLVPYSHESHPSPVGPVRGDPTRDPGVLSHEPV
jgi:hypothetical protein